MSWNVQKRMACKMGANAAIIIVSDYHASMANWVKRDKQKWPATLRREMFDPSSLATLSL